MFRFDGKICNFIEREIYVACEIFLAHKFWSINPRVAIPVNLISVDRESEKVAPPRRFLDRFAPLFFSPLLPLSLGRADFRPRVSRVYYSLRGWEKGRPHANGGNAVVNCFRFIASFSPCLYCYSHGKILGRHTSGTLLNYFWSGGWNYLISQRLSDLVLNSERDLNLYAWWMNRKKFWKRVLPFFFWFNFFDRENIRNFLWLLILILNVAFVNCDCHFRARRRIDFVRRRAIFIIPWYVIYRVCIFKCYV